MTAATNEPRQRRTAMTTRFGALITGTLLLVASAAQGQTARTAPMMREKLVHTQRVLEALTTSDYRLLDGESAALARIAESPRWQELKTPELRGYTDDFVKSVGNLFAAAKRRDLDAAAADYGALVTTCYQCHKRLKGMRVAR
jgi:cytochrome c556